jgi:hypothetical protein
MRHVEDAAGVDEVLGMRRGRPCGGLKTKMTGRGVRSARLGGLRWLRLSEQFGVVFKWISASVMPQPGLAATR